MDDTYQYCRLLTKHSLKLETEKYCANIFHNKQQTSWNETSAPASLFAGSVHWRASLQYFRCSSGRADKHGINWKCLSSWLLRLLPFMCVTEKLYCDHKNAYCIVVLWVKVRATLHILLWVRSLHILLRGNWWLVETQMVHVSLDIFLLKFPNNLPTYYTTKGKYLLT